VVPLERMGLHAEESANVNQTKGHRHSTITRRQRCVSEKKDFRTSYFLYIYIFIYIKKIVLINICVKKRLNKKNIEKRIFDKILSFFN